MAAHTRLPEVPVLKQPALRAAGRDVRVPFSVMLADGRSVVMRRVLRLLPGKRISGEAELDGRRVFAKLFIADAAERHGRAEHQGVEALRAATIHCPALLLADRLLDGGYVVISEFVEDAVSWATVFESVFSIDAAVPEPAQVLKIMQPVLARLAQLHRAGLVQHDLHPGNFLLAAGLLLVIDGDAVARLPEKNRTEAAAVNLGVLFAQMPVFQDAVIPACLALYQQAGGITGISPDMLQAAVDRHRAWRLRDYLRKSLRDCTLFAVSHDMGRFVSVVRSAQTRLAALLADPDAAITAGERLKSGNTCTVARVRDADDGTQGDWVIKRYNLKNTVHALSRLWRPSRAWHAWQEAHRLRVYGIATPQPLALIEERIGPLRRRAWLVCESCPGPNLLEHLSPDSPPGKAEAAALTGLFEALCRLKISHGDLKATNLLWHSGRIWLIDLDACTQHRSAAAWQRAWRRDRQRLLRNWPEGSVLREWLERSLPTECDL